MESKKDGYLTISSAGDLSYYPYKLIWHTEQEQEQKRLPDKYIVNKDAAILFWSNNKKTVIKRCKEDKSDPIKAFLWAYFEEKSGLSRTKANKYLEEVLNSLEIFDNIKEKKNEKRK